jgi:HlyD family secretion protein
MKNRVRLKKFASVVAIIILAGVIYFYMSRPETISAELVVVRRGDLVVEVSDTGQTRFRNVNTVLSPQTGWLTQLHAHTGEQVTQGKSPLATLTAAQAPLIDSRSRASLKAQAEAARAQEQQAKEQLTRVQGNLQASQSALQRAERVLAAGGVSLQEVESLRARTAELRAEVRSARALLDALKHTSEAALWSFQKIVTHSNPESLLLKASSSGVISWVYSDKPRFVAMGEPLFDIARPGELYFEIELLARDSLALQTGQEVRFSEIATAGKVSSISPTAQPKISPLGISEQRVRVRIDFNQALPNSWPAGLELEAHIEIQRSRNTLILPLTSIWVENGESFVFIAENRKILRRTVRTGAQSNQEIEILSGLSGTEQVVRFPSSAMREGQSLSTRI